MKQIGTQELAFESVFLLAENPPQMFSVGEKFNMNGFSIGTTRQQYATM
jgi:hypothetical protein